MVNILPVGVVGIDLYQGLCAAGIASARSGAVDRRFRQGGGGTRSGGEPSLPISCFRFIRVFCFGSSGF